LSQWWTPPLRLQVSDCSTSLTMCDVTSTAVFVQNLFNIVLVLFPDIFKRKLSKFPWPQWLYFNFFSASLCITFLSDIIIICCSCGKSNGSYKDTVRFLSDTIKFILINAELIYKNKSTRRCIDTLNLYRYSVCFTLSYRYQMTSLVCTVEMINFYVAAENVTKIRYTLKLVYSWND
jgi:hypothetical protein